MIINDALEEIVNTYEDKLRKKYNITGELTQFQRMLLKQGIICGYEYKEHELEDENNKEKK